MKIELFDYYLPPELIAKIPTKRRDHSRLMVLDRKSGQVEIHPFKEIIDYLKKGDALVINDTRVFKARLIGNRSSGAEVEVFLTRAVLQHTTEGKTTQCVRLWESLVRPSRRLKEGEKVWFDNKHSVTLERNEGEGKWIVSFPSKSAEVQIISKFGRVPLPQYIDRKSDTTDSNRYQTVFARKDKANAVAAPTAGLHFTKSLLEKINAKGVKIVEVTLDVGPGTFKPVMVDDINQHKIDPELATLSKSAAKAINKVIERGGRVVAVGTTSVRTLEFANLKNKQIEQFSGEVDLYIKPGFRFRVVNSLLTNFHLPKSSLLILVSAFAGREKILDSYEQAIIQKMRFYSYGDAMLIL